MSKITQSESKCAVSIVVGLSQRFLPWLLRRISQGAFKNPNVLTAPQNKWAKISRGGVQARFAELPR